MSCLIVLEYILWNSIWSINVFSLSVASPSQIALKILFLTFSHLWVESDMHKFCSALNIAFPFASTSDFALWLICICWRWTVLQNALCVVTQATGSRNRYFISVCVTLNWELCKTAFRFPCDQYHDGFSDKNMYVFYP